MKTFDSLLRAYDEWLAERVQPLAASIRSLGPASSDSPEAEDDPVGQSGASATGPLDEAVAQEAEVAPASSRPSLVAFIDEIIGPLGSPERDEFERHSAHCRRRMAVIHRLAAPLLIAFGRPSWEDAYGNTHSLGHLAYCWWHDLLDSSSVYAALDGLAFHYFDDAYVLPLDSGLERIARKTAHRLNRRRHHPQNRAH